MGTLTALMHSTASALVADQTALSVTGDNISNQNTDGYTRRVVNWSSGVTVSFAGTTGSSGITATAVAQRDSVLQKSLQQATDASSASSTRATLLDTLQSLFTIGTSGEDAAGIGAAISDFFNDATALAASPTDATARQTMYTAAQTLASTMNRTAAQLSSQTSSLNQQVTSSVSTVNGLLSTVASLNRQISGAAPTGDVDSLKDQRDQAVLSLSKLVGVNAVTASDGSIGLSLSNGTPLVSGSQAVTLTTATVSGKTEIFSGSADITSSVQSGSLGASLQVRDSDIPVVQQQLDTLAAGIASAVNTQNAQGTDANGNTGGDIFSGTTAATLSVAISSSGGIAASSDGSNATAMAALATQALINGQTPSGALSSMITALGQTVSNADADNSADAAVLTQTATQMANVSSVSLDTEAANLTQYQRSYEAAAKVLSIVNELMAQAINLGTETAVS